jgi:predicted DNA-binding transcriptional regulator AlpA
MKKLQTNDRYYTVADLTVLLTKTQFTICRMVKDGRLPKPSKDGKLNVWKKLDLDRWLYAEKHLQ